jgi:hypothetical protein
MNRITRMMLVTLGVALVVLAPVASAQSNCKDAKGDFVEVFFGGDRGTGTLTNGGWLNGTTVSVFSPSAPLPTPDPTAITFISAFTLATIHGQLKGNRLYLLDFVTGQGTTMIKIDPAASTGRFAGATGVLFTNHINSSIGPLPHTFPSVVGGQVCFAQ